MSVIKVRVRGERWPHPTKLGRRRRIFFIRVGDHQISLTKKDVQELTRKLLKALASELKEEA